MAKKFLLTMSDSSSLISKFPIPGAGTCSFHANKIAAIIVVSRNFNTSTVMCYTYNPFDQLLNNQENQGFNCVLVYLQLKKTQSI